MSIQITNGSIDDIIFNLLKTNEDINNYNHKNKSSPTKNFTDTSDTKTSSSYNNNQDTLNNLINELLENIQDVSLSKFDENKFDKKDQEKIKLINTSKESKV